MGHGRVAVEPYSPLQPAQVFVVGSHDGVAPVHAVAFVAEHCAQAPVVRHAGCAAVGQDFVAPEPLSPLHGAHLFVAASHAGVAPVQSVDPGVQPTHMPAEQTGAVAGHGAVAPLPASPLHCTHAPPAQTGNAPVH